MAEQRNPAEVLLEALPYIRRFAGKTIVIKFGGAAMQEAELRKDFARDLVLLQYVGIKPVIVHGGGPQINRMLQELAIPTEFVDGHRITDEASMDVVEMVLGKINKEIVALINSEGGRAVGISGKDGNLARARVHTIEKVTDEGTETISLGRVGKLGAEQINPSLIGTLENAGYVPVLAPIAVNEENHTLNVNADTMAGAVASALRAEKLILLTDTPGVLVEGETITGVTPTRIWQLKEEGRITGGMIPKVDCCVDAIYNGVSRTHIIDGRVPHAVLLEVFTDSGVGTMISFDSTLKKEGALHASA